MLQLHPLLDVLKPSRKENADWNCTSIPKCRNLCSSIIYFQSNDTLTTTHRETTEDSKFHLNVNRNQNGMGYLTTENQAYDTNRQDTGNFFYAGNASAGARTRETTSYYAGLNQRNNDIKASTIDGRLVPGNMKLKNNNLNIRQKDKQNS